MMFEYKYTALGELKIYNRTVRSATCLPPEEQLLLLFILDRTVGWSRVWQTISRSEFARGVSRRRNGSRIIVVRGTRLSPAQVGDGLQRLQALGAIRLEQHGSQVAYKIEEHWLHPDLESLGMWELNESDYDYETAAGGSD